jgi:hypothetical protein
MDAHNPKSFALDLLSLFIPGENWRFSQLTEGYWSKLPMEISEASVYLGYAVIILLGYLWIKRYKSKFAVNVWFFIAGFFFLMALGPVLQIGGKTVYESLMPYTLLEKMLPFLKLSGVPIRMVVMVTLAASVLSAMAITLMSTSSRGRVFIFLVIALLFVEYWPQSLPSTPTGVPNYIAVLADLPNDGGVLDEATPTKYLLLYYQTAHHKPMVFGYVARTPSSVAEKEKGLNRAINRENYAALWDTYHVRYIVTSDMIEYDDPYVSVELIYQDDEVNIYRLECKCESGE